MKYSPVSDLLRQASINTDDQLIFFFNSSWQYYPETGRSTGAYTIFYQGGTIDHVTHVPGTVSQSSAKIEYNTACTAGISLVHFSMLIHEFLNKYQHIVPETEPLIILHRKYTVCMAKNCKDTKHTKHITRRVHLVRNDENFKLNKIEWCEGCL